MDHNSSTSGAQHASRMLFALALLVGCAREPTPECKKAVFAAQRDYVLELERLDAKRKSDEARGPDIAAAMEGAIALKEADQRRQERLARIEQGDCVASK
jgi:hypothetical protein